MHTLEENKAKRLKKPIERRIFPKGNDAKGRSYEDFAGSLDYENTAKDLFQIVKTKKTELLFLALFLRGGTVEIKPKGKAKVEITLP